MSFFIKTEIIKKEYLINHDLKQKIIKEHIDWIKKLKKEGINIKSGFLAVSYTHLTLPTSFEV